MNWRTKAYIQRVLSRIPGPLTDIVYYQIQRRFGILKTSYMEQHFLRVSEIVDLLRRAGRTVVDKTFVEIGTGRTINIPLGLWLCGAQRVHTFDLNRYLKSKFVVQCIDYLEENLQRVTSILGEAVVSDRLEQLLRCKRDLDSLLTLAQISYQAPANTAELPLPSGGVDYHYSVSVMEHIPPPIIRTILGESKRLLGPDGLCVHIIDPSDHFGHSDRSISLVNFLMFSDHDWDRIAGNELAYHNRLRIYDLMELAREAGLDLIEE